MADLAGVSPEGTVPLAERVVVAFAQLLRGAGLEVPVGSVVAFASALAAVGLDRRQHVYWAGRATLVRRPEDAAVYDRAFAAFFDREAPGGAGSPEPAGTSIDLVVDDESASSAEQPGRDETSGEPSITVRYSAVEVLRHQDFAAFSDADWAEARLLMARLRVAPDVRRSRRTEPSKGRHGRPDLPRTVRRALACDGEPIERAWRGPSSRPRRVVYVVDVSGSMQPYARAYLRLAHASVTAREAGGVEVFALGTRLTRITRQLSWRDPDAALADAGRAVADWYGGTRLGEGLRRFNDEWGGRGVGRGAIVVILSDGWDRGEPAQLAVEMARLRRLANRVVWVNPLKASPGYSPLARGMAAALPFVDDFVEGHSIAALEALVAVLGDQSRSPSRPGPTAAEGRGKRRRRPDAAPDGPEASAGGSDAAALR